MNMQLLDNIVWQSLSGAHAKYSSGTNAARRYVSGFPPIIGFSDLERPDFAALAPYCELGEHFYCGGWSGPAPSGWHVHGDLLAHQLVWDAAAPVRAADDALVAVPLGAKHVPQMLELVAIAQPGPFAARTRELGEYFGVFDGDDLIAMAGERMQAGALREVSGVCTHPDFQGRGLARGLIAHLVRRELRRHQLPFLHVMHDNLHARRLYEHMGFRHHREMVIRVVAREP